MNVGQRVMTIAPWFESDCTPPPIGALGVITEPLDEDAEYFVLFDEFPCPIGAEPDWFVPAWAIIPIDDGDRVVPWERSDADLLRIE